MKKVSNINCTFYNTYGLCEAKESSCFAKQCLLIGKSFAECTVRLKYVRPVYNGYIMPNQYKISS